MQKITKTTLIQKSTNINSREFDGETVMMNKSMENYFGLDEVGTRVWQLLETEQSLVQLCEALTQEYDVALNDCIQDTTAFLEKLLNDDLISVRES